MSACHPQIQKWPGPPLRLNKTVDAAAGAVRDLLKVAPEGLHVIASEQSHGIVVAMERVGAVFSLCLLEQTRNAEKWHAVEWSRVRPCPVLRQEVFVARHEMLAWIMERFLSMKVEATNDN
jgi:hypothetical protein